MGKPSNSWGMNFAAHANPSPARKPEDAENAKIFTEGFSVLMDEENRIKIVYGEPTPEGRSLTLYLVLPEGGKRNKEKLAKLSGLFDLFEAPAYNFDEEKGQFILIAKQNATGFHLIDFQLKEALWALAISHGLEENLGRPEYERLKKLRTTQLQQEGQGLEFELDTTRLFQLYGKDGMHLPSISGVAHIGQIVFSPDRTTIRTENLINAVGVGEIARTAECINQHGKA